MNINYKNTLNIPNTKFSMKGNLIYKEIEILNYWNKININLLIRKKKNKKEIFFLHDGPPYANGDIHLGHALNKILKDIIIKYKNMSGFNSPFIVGWDCHGLPIELKINDILLKNKKNFNKNNFYEKCRKYAKEQINNQKNDFKRLGIIGDWDNYYYTMNYNTESNIINILGKLFNLGFLNRYNKPNYWCIKCKSSISESEIEYKKNIFESFYIMYEILEKNYILDIFNIKEKKFNKLFIISWTTTPWTIIDSEAISINENIDYFLIYINNNFYIISNNFINKFIKNNIYNYKIINVIKGLFLLKINCINSIDKKNIIPIINNSNIDINIGTGIVNISPGHNLIDYEIGIKNNLKIINSFNENGIYIGKKINKKLNFEEISKYLKNILINEKKLFYSEKINDKYPYCYRHNYPIIFRSIYQWFINLDHKNLRDRAIYCAENVNWIPKWGKKKIINMIKNRSDWCISRQRKWGVPITFFINKENNSIHPKSDLFFKKISNIIKKGGIESWWKLNIKNFLNKNDLLIYKKSEDILDVWFDSGTTFISAINKKKYKNIIQSDIYLEGNDQYRGWFMSSLLIYVALFNISPYKNVITHGFILDNLSNKMSKSLGNTIKVKDLLKLYGSDIIRLWISCSNYKKDIKISNENLNRISDIYRKIRNTIRFLISSLYDFNVKKDLIKFNKMISLDKWIINKTYNLQKKVINYYDKYDFYNVINNILIFCSTDLGSIYLEITKDRQYTFNKNSFSRKSCQTAIYHILESITRWISPILSFTSDEIWNYIPGENRSKTIFTEEWYKNINKFNKKEIFNEEYWNEIFKIKSYINNLIEREISKGNIKSSLELKIIFYVKNINNIFFKKLYIMKDELKYIFIVSELEIKYSDCNNNKKNNIKNLEIKILKIINCNKCNRCWNMYYIKNLINIENNKICLRCILNINNISIDRKYV